MTLESPPRIDAQNRSKVHNLGKNTLHRVYRFQWSHPNASHQEIASALHISKGNVKVTVHRLRKLDLARRCPECWAVSVAGGVCQACGFEPEAPDLPLEVRFDEQSPTNSLHAGNQLGSMIGRSGNYNQLGGDRENPTGWLKGIYPNDGLLLKQRMDRALEDPLTRQVKSEVMEWLKAYYPPEAITDYAGKLCVKEVVEFSTNYPDLARSKNLRKQLASRVIARLRFLYPTLRRPHIQEVTGLQ
ncbi:MAG: sigma-70 region 4 domain-containing protein [Nitrososphaerota archaeon]|nr:sigma-70 region 4 domain-containing protein [Nitrososphaerota archaeon]